MLDAGMSTKHVAMHTGCCSRATNDLPRRGRPRAKTRGQDIYIMNTHLRNRFQTATATAANTPGLHNNQISLQTVRNRVRENGLHARRPCVGWVLTLTQRHRQNCVNWARVHTRWIRQRWNTVLFLDESRFSLQRGDCRVRVYRRRNATVVFLNKIVSEGGGSVMV